MMLDHLWALPAQLAWVTFACALVFVIATTNRRQRRALGVGVLLMAVVGLTYQVTGGGDLTARGRPPVSGFIYWANDAVNFTQVTAANTGPRVAPTITASTSSPPSGMTWSSTATTGGFMADQAGATYTGIIFNDYVSIRAADVTFQDCEFRGGAAGTNERALLMCVSANVLRARVLFCKLRPTNPTEYLNGIQGHDWYAYRCNVSGTVDPFRVQDTLDANGSIDVWIDCCYGHNWYYQAPSVVQQNSDQQTHNDGCQVSNGLNLKITGCAFWGYCDTTISSPSQPLSSKIPNPSGKGNGTNVLAIFQFTCNVGVVGNVQLLCNDLHGATVKMQFSQKGRGAMSGIQVRNNRAADDGTQNNFALIDQSTLNNMIAEGGISGNVWKSGARAGQTIGVNNTGFAGRTDT